MTVKKASPYKRAPRPTDPQSMPKYLDDELRKLEEVISSQKAAIEQLQQATSLPIT